MVQTPLTPAMAIFGLLTAVASCLGQPTAPPAPLPTAEIAQRPTSRPGSSPAEHPTFDAHVCAKTVPGARLYVDGNSFTELGSSARATRGQLGAPVLVALHADAPSLGHRVPARDVAWVSLRADRLGTHNVSSEDTDLLYWHYRGGNRHGDPSEWMHDGELDGTITVAAAARGEGDRTCGTFDITLHGKREIRLVGTFNHVATSTASVEEGELS